MAGWAGIAVGRGWVVLGVLCTGAVPKIAILFLTRGSRVVFGGAGLGRVGDGGGVEGGGPLLPGVVGESGVIAVCVCVIGVSWGLVCRGGGSCVGILYR